MKRKGKKEKSKLSQRELSLEALQQAGAKLASKRLR
jgi:hypothetical protein